MAIEEKRQEHDGWGSHIRGQLLTMLKRQALYASEMTNEPSRTHPEATSHRQAIRSSTFAMQHDLLLSVTHYESR